VGSHQSEDLFLSEQGFRHAFERGLGRLLDIGGLNLFVLVSANASFEQTLFDNLGGRLSELFSTLRADLCEALVNGYRINEADDDLLVFLKIASIGFERLALTEHRSAGDWEVQFNHLRSFRPLRNSGRPMQSIHAPFDEQGFHFNKPFMQQEALWSGKMLGHRIDLYYNKYPFVDLHCLLVPEREACLPQYLNHEAHTYVWSLVQHLGSSLPGVKVGYNALGAFASVNHLHLQLFVRRRPLPVELDRWAHNGGDRDYPVGCLKFDNPDAAWAFITRLHQNNETYNLLYVPGGLYCLPRKKQGGFDLAAWSNGFSWYEMCGGMITFNHEDFSTLNDQQIVTDLSLAELQDGPMFRLS